MRLAPWFFPLALATCAAAQAATPAPTAPDAKRQSELQAIFDMSEPGAQQRALEAFLRQYPHAPEAADVYNQLISDATALNDDRQVLADNERLQALDPGDIGQRIKTLNLLLLETDPQNRALATRYADDLALAVEAKAHEGPPAGLGTARWQLDLNRMRAAAAMFQGAAAQENKDWARAEKDFTNSLGLEESENAAEHLAQVYAAEQKWPEALNSYALALALPGDDIADRAALRATATAIYHRLHGDTDEGLGDLILRQFDAVAARDAAETAAVDPRAAVNAHAGTALDYTLADLAGGKHRLRDQHGKVVVLSFWATACDACEAQQRQLAALRARDTDHDVIFIAVALDEDPAAVAAWLKSAAPAALPAGELQWVDAGLADYLNLQAAPATLVLDPAGAIVYRREGLDVPDFTAEVAAAVATAKNGD